MHKQESALYQWMQRSERVVSEGDEEKVTAVSQTEGQHEEGNGEGEGGWDFPTREPRVILLHNLFTQLGCHGPLSALSHRRHHSSFLLLESFSPSSESDTAFIHISLTLTNSVLSFEWLYG